MMIPDLERATLDQLAETSEKYGSGLTDAELARKQVPLGAIKVAPRVFQSRDMQEENWAKDRHISALENCVKRGIKLPPILVFAVAGERIVVDGHCRLEGYRRAGLSADTPIAVKHLLGTFDGALRASVVTNSKDKLPMTHSEKLEAAWRLVIISARNGSLSQRDIVRDTQVGKGTVGNMQKLLNTAVDFDPRGMTWQEAKRRNRPSVEYDEDWEELTARNWASDLGSTFGRRPSGQPRVFLRAIELAYQTVYEEMLEILKAEHEEQDL